MASHLRSTAAACSPRRRDVLALAGLGLLAGSPLQAGSAWRLASGYAGESFQTETLRGWAQDVAAASAGGWQVDVQPDGALYKLDQITGAVQRGQVQAGEVILSAWIDQLPLAGADSVPFICSSYGDARRLWQHQRPLLVPQAAALGLQALYAVPWPPQCLYSRAAVRSVRDLRGLRMRTYNRTTEQLAAMVGATPVAVAMRDVGDAFARGRIDAMITSSVTGVENEVWRHVQHFQPINAWFPKNVVFANLEAWRGLSPAWQQAGLDAAARAEQAGWARSAEAARSSMRRLEAMGMSIDPVAPEFRRELDRLGESLSLAWVRGVGSDANRLFVPYFTQR